MRKRLLLLMMFLIAAMIVSACGGDDNSGSDPEPVEENENTAVDEPAEEPEMVGDSAAGKASYDSVCVACHGADATGVVNLGKDLTTSEFTQDMADADLVAFIKVGRSVSDPANTTGVDMPPKGGNPALSDQDLYDIVAYLRTLEK